MRTRAIAPSSLAHDEEAFRAKIPYPLVATNLEGVYASPAPSKDFDPNKATACELVKNGLLWRRPCTKDVRALHCAWHKALSRSWPENGRILPELHPQLGRTHALEKPMKRIADTHFASPAWAGAGTRGASWTGVIGFWKIPMVAKSEDSERPAAGRMSTWIGLDGFDAGPGMAAGGMLLAGTEQHFNACGVPFCAAWFTWEAPAREGSPPYIFQTNIANFPVGPGQQIFCSVQYIGTMAGYIYFANETTGQHLSITLAPPPGATFGGNSAQWIVEVPGSREPTQAPLRSSPVVFTSAIACGSSGALANPQTADRVNIEDATGVRTSVAVGDYAAAIEFREAETPRPRPARDTVPLKSRREEKVDATDGIGQERYIL